MAAFTASQIVDDLARYVVRAFHSPQHVAMYDALVREKWCRDDELAAKLLLPKAQIRRLLIDLQKDFLVKKDELREPRPDGRSQVVWYWYIDYRQLVDIIKWRILKMTETAKAMQKSDLESVEYKCQGHCQRKYTLVQFSGLSFNGQGQPVCEDCGGDVDEIAVANDKDGSLLQKLNLQLHPIKLLLKNTENFEIERVVRPAERRALELSRENEEANEAKEAGGPTGRTGLGTSGHTGGGKEVGMDYMGNKERSLVVDLDGDGDKADEPSGPKRAVWMKSSAEIEDEEAAQRAREAAGAQPQVSGPKTLAQAAGGSARGAMNPDDAKKADEFEQAYLQRLIEQHNNSNGINKRKREDGGDHKAGDPPAVPGTSAAAELVDAVPDDPAGLHPAKKPATEAAVTADTATTKKENTANGDTGGEELDDWTVAVQGKHVAWDDVTDDHITQMTVKERARYDRLLAQGDGDDDAEYYNDETEF